MTQIVKFPVDFYDSGVVKYAAGQYYPLNSETQSLVTYGYAELIDEDNSADHIEILAAKAKLASEAAAAAVAQADALVAEAAAAQALADAAAKAKPAPAAAPAAEEAAAVAEPAAA